MSAPSKQRDPAGLDQTLLAAAKSLTRFVERAAEAKGFPVNLWDGTDGLGAVLDERLQAAGVSNKRLPELLTPRLVVKSFTPAKRKARKRRAA